MHSEFEALFSFVFPVIWIIINLILMGLAFYRFRKTVSGLLLSGSFLLLALDGILIMILRLTIMSGLGGSDIRWAVFWFLSSLVTFILYIVIAVGIAFIPKSLKKLNEID